MKDEIYILWSRTKSVLYFNGDFLDPFYAINNLLITQSNQNVACLAEEQAAQYQQRVSTPEGYADLVYSVVNVPIEGFLEGKNDNTVLNEIWDIIYDLYQNFDGKRSMTCKQTGYIFGRLWAKLMNFEAPNALYYADVSV